MLPPPWRPAPPWPPGCHHLGGRRGRDRARRARSDAGAQRVGLALATALSTLSALVTFDRRHDDPRRGIHRDPGLRRVAGAALAVLARDGCDPGFDPGHRPGCGGAGCPGAAAGRRLPHRPRLLPGPAWPCLPGRLRSSLSRTPPQMVWRPMAMGSAFVLVGAKAVDDLHRDLLFGEALDVHHEAFFVHAHQAHGLAFGIWRGRCGRCGARSPRRRWGFRS